MQSPIQIVTLLRPKTRGDLLAAAAVASMVFTATPFLLPVVAEQYDVSLGSAGLISAAQLGGFVLASWIVGRFVHPARSLLVVSLVLAAVCNFTSAAVPWFEALLALRLLGGIALGVVAWLGWQEVFGDDDRMGDVAVVGPVVGIVGAPIASFLADWWGADAVFIALGVFALVPLLVPHPRTPLSANAPPRGARSRPIPVTRVILASLGILTMGGSAIFVFAAALGIDQRGLDPFVVSLAFSANALTGIPAARWRGPRPLAGLWLAGTAVMALLVTNVASAAVFWVGIALWGFAFWMGVPAVFKLLAERSRNPADRAGDAQSIMAAGRVAGPLLGALFVEAGSIEVLGLAAAGLMGAACLTLVVVELKVPPIATPAPVRVHGSRPTEVAASGGD